VGEFVSNGTLPDDISKIKVFPKVEQTQAQAQAPPQEPQMVGGGYYYILTKDG
jgi:hypothetical protein